MKQLREVLVPLTQLEKVRIHAAIAEISKLLRIDRKNLENKIKELVDERDATLK